MTLGSIFEKLSVVKLRSIAKWYGILVMLAVCVVFFIFFAWAVGNIVVQVVTVLGFWGTTIVLVVATAGFCVNYFRDEIFPDGDREDSWDRYQRENLMAKQTILAGKPRTLRNLEQIRELVASMMVDQSCDINIAGETYHFDGQQEALDFLDGKIAERKTE